MGLVLMSVSFVPLRSGARAHEEDDDDDEGEGPDLVVGALCGFCSKNLTPKLLPRDHN